MFKFEWNIHDEKFDQFAWCLIHYGHSYLIINDSNNQNLRLTPTIIV